MDPLLKGKNYEKIYELREDKQPAGFAFVNACWNEGKYFTILEAYRSAERQNYYFQQGRTRKGSIITHLDGYKNLSKHQLRLAIDFKPLDNTKKGYQDIADIAAR